MCFIENNDLVFGKQCATTGKVNAIQVQIDNDDVRLMCCLTSLLGKAVVSLRAFRFPGAFV